MSELTPLQEWFLIHGESIPPAQEARDTFDEVFHIGIEKLSREYMQIAMPLKGSTDFSDQEKVLDLSRDLIGYVKFASSKAVEEINLGHLFPLTNVELSMYHLVLAKAIECSK